VAVAAVQSQRLAPACFQPVSSASFTGASRTASRACSCDPIRAALVCRSKAATVPSDTGTSKAASTHSRTERLLRWNRPLR
jgi:hypothetical protein